MTTVRSDVLVLGSGLGGLVAASYLARARLRVTLIEEDAQAKRPPLVREPFLMSGLASGGRIQRILREIALPLIDQRQIRADGVPLQVVLPEARIDVLPERSALAKELASHGLIDADAADRWLSEVSERAERARAGLWEDAQPGGPVKRRFGHRTAAAPILAPLPPVPSGLEAFIEAQLVALSTLAAPGPGPAAALLLQSAQEGAFRMPHAGMSFLELFRRRFLTLHGEVHAVGEFGLVADGGDIGLELPRGRLLARALVLAAPRGPVAALLDAAGAARPGWLRPGGPTIVTRCRLFRLDKQAAPVGMASRVIIAGEEPDETYWLARSADPKSQAVEWLVVGGPGAPRVSRDRPLGQLAPFAESGTLVADSGSSPRWDLDSSELRFVDPEPRPLTRQRPLVASVGPELAPGLGFEGEILQARRVALRLADRLGARRGVL